MEKLETFLKVNRLLPVQDTLVPRGARSAGQPSPDPQVGSCCNEFVRKWAWKYLKVRKRPWGKSIFSVHPNLLRYSKLEFIHNPAASRIRINESEHKKKIFSTNKKVQLHSLGRYSRPSLILLSITCGLLFNNGYLLNRRVNFSETEECVEGIHISDVELKKNFFLSTNLELKRYLGRYYSPSRYLLCIIYPSLQNKENSLNLKVNLSESEECFIGILINDDELKKKFFFQHNLELQRYLGRYRIQSLFLVCIIYRSLHNKEYFLNGTVKLSESEECVIRIRINDDELKKKLKP